MARRMTTRQPTSGRLARVLTADDAAEVAERCLGDGAQAYLQAVRAAAAQWGFAGAGIGTPTAHAALLVCPWSDLPPGHPLRATRPFTAGFSQGRPRGLPAAALLLLRQSGTVEPRELLRVTCRALRGQVNGIDACGSWWRPTARYQAPAVPVLGWMGFVRVPGVPGRYHLDLGRTVVWRPRSYNRLAVASLTGRPAAAARTLGITD